MATVADRNRAGFFGWISIAAILAVGACSNGRVLERDAGEPDGADQDGTGGKGPGGSAVIGIGGRGSGGMGTGGASGVGTGGAAVIGIGGTTVIGTGGHGTGGTVVGTGGMAVIGTGGHGTGGLINPGTGGMGTGGTVLPGTGGTGTGGAGCPLPQTSCSGTCRDTTSDLHNCGTCGRDCQFGSCANSHCEPAVLATASNVVALASDGSSVYALDYTGGIAYGCALAQCGGGGTMTAIRTGLASPVDVLPVPSVGSVFVSQFGAGTVYNLSPTGAVKAMIAIPSSTITIGLATEGSNLYIGTASTIGIQKTPLAVNTPATAFPVLGRELLYDPASNAIFALQLDQIAKCPVGGTTCTTFLPQTPFQLNGAVIAAGRLFFTLIGDPPTAANNGLYGCATSAATCTPTALLAYPAYSNAFWLTADASFVYVRISPAGQDNGIYRCATAGCGGVATPVFTTSTLPISISQVANDAGAIYWSNFSSTAVGRGVLRLAKQP